MSMQSMSVKPEQVNAFFRLMDQRYARVSTIITTNLDYDAWYELFGSKPLVDALLDRLRHHCITIRIDGPSLREPAPMNAEPPVSASSRGVASGVKPRRTAADGRFTMNPTCGFRPESRHGLTAFRLQ